MAIVECKDCKKMVSTSAEICPQCGAKYPASNIPSKVLIHRSTGINGFAVKMVVFVNEENKGELSRGESLSFELPYGDHKIKIKQKILGGTARDVTLRILPARIYKIEIGLGLGGIDFEASSTES